MSAVFPTPLNIKDFRSNFTEFGTVPDATLNFLWVKVRAITPSLFFGLDDTTALYYFYTVLGHLCRLWLTKQAGRLINATTGNTSSTFENLTPDMAGSLQWWSQTSYGSEIVQFMKQQGGFSYVY